MSQSSACHFKGNNVNFIDKTRKKTCLTFHLPMINKPCPALRLEKGHYLAWLFWELLERTSVLNPLRNARHCTALLKVLLYARASGTAIPSPPAWVPVELHAKALSLSCIPVGSPCGRSWCATVECACCLQQALPSIYFLNYLWHHSARSLPGGDKRVDMRERTENQSQ